MNTVIEYLYRDAGNNKVWNEAVINGCLSQEQIDIVCSSLEDGVYFIPRFVGFPEERFDSYDCELDHAFFELEPSWIHNEDRLPTVSITPQEVTEAFVNNKGKWFSLL